MLILQNISYIHPTKDILFDGLNLTVNKHDKIALIGNNGSGKSTLLKIIAGMLSPSSGYMNSEAMAYYVPQIFGQFNHLTIAQALGIDVKLNALKAILNGDTSEQKFHELNEDWTIEERCQEALHYWQLNRLDLDQKMETLSGGQKTKIFLAGISIHQPSFVLLDEPSNHMDTTGRKILYDYIKSTTNTLIVVSHDRELLNLLNKVFALNKNEVLVYGGNYDFYMEQKQIESDALHQDIQSKEKALKKAQKKEQDTLERQQKLDARGKKKQEKAGVARIMMNTLRNNAENSTSKLKGVHAEKIEGISKELHTLRSSLPDIDKMKFGFNASGIHRGKILLKADKINFYYGTEKLWKRDHSFTILSGERIALKGDNGSGKTTLLKLILGMLEPQTGELYSAYDQSVYIDQEYSLIDNSYDVYEQAQQFNTSGLQEHEIKIRLSRFLFSKDDWNKPCSALSGGERMRLTLCCLTIHSQSPDMIVLDEPTNNLDIQNIEMLTAAINNYQGTLIVISHDETFLKELKIERILSL